MKGKSESKPQESVFGALQLKEEQEEEEDDDLDGMELNAEDFQFVHVSRINAGCQPAGVCKASI